MFRICIGSEFQVAGPATVKELSAKCVPQSCHVLMIGDGDRYSDCTCQLGTRVLYRERRRTSRRMTQVHDLLALADYLLT